MTTNTQPYTITDGQRAIILDQIGRMNILSISGGRIRNLPDGIELPVSNGFAVRIRLTPADDYTVQRVFTRNGREFDHGTKAAVYCDTLRDEAYRAGMFRSYDRGEW